ncbi:MAG: fibronectin type III domain-containing protein [Syntrophomonas sp.]
MSNARLMLAEKKTSLWLKTILAVLMLFMAFSIVTPAQAETLTPYIGENTTQWGTGPFWILLTNVVADDIGVLETTENSYTNVIKTSYDASQPINFEITIGGSGTDGYGSNLQPRTAPYIKIYDSTRNNVVAEYSDGTGALKYISGVDAKNGGKGSVIQQTGTVVTMGLDANTLEPDTEYYLCIEPGLQNKRNPANLYGKTVWFRFTTSSGVSLPAIPTWSDGASLSAEDVLNTELVLRWPQVSNPDELAGYKVYVDGVEEASLPSIQTYYELYGLNSGQKYILSVKPYNETGELGDAIETMVVTPGAGGLSFTFNPYAADEGESGYYHNYDIVNPVDMDSFSLAWNFSNGLDENLRSNLECIHLIDKSTDDEIQLDLGIEPYSLSAEGVIEAGDFKYISTGGGTGGGTGTGTGSVDVNRTRMLKFEPGADTLSKMTKGEEYVIEIDPEFTANNGTNKLGKIFTFAFTTAIDDTQAPIWPAGAQITSTKVGTDSFVLSWPEATDNVDITEYELYNNGSLIKTFNNEVTSYKMEGLTPNTTYNLVLKARDAKSNYTLLDLTLSVSTLISDNQAPTWSTGSKLTADNILPDTMDLYWTPADDNVEVTGYRLLKNGSAVTEFDADTFTYHIAQLAPAASYIFQMQARDKAGNYSTTGPKLVISTLDGEADTTPPNWSSNGYFQTSVSNTGGKTYVTYMWPWANDNVAVTSYMVYKDGVYYATVDAYTNSFNDTLDYNNSRYIYSVFAVDAAGNRSVEGSPMEVLTGDPNEDNLSPYWPADTNITLSEFTGMSAVKVKWTPAQDNVKVRGYVVVKDGLWVEWTDNGIVETPTRGDCFVVYNPYINYINQPSPVYPELVSGETYTFSVKAFDVRENSSKGDPKITFVMGTNPTAGAGIPFALTNVENKRGSLNSITGALNQVLAPQDPENTKFTWTFDEPLITGYESKITLTNITTGEAVILSPTNFQYSEVGGKDILTLDLTSIKLADKTNYIVKLDKTLTAQSSKQLGFDIAWQFTTDVADKTAPYWGTNDTLNVNYVKDPTIATLTWPAATDNVAVTQYKVYQDETLLTALPADVLTYDVTGLAVNTLYNFKVITEDYLQNASTPLTISTTTPVADSIAPAWQSGAALTFADISSDNVKLSWPAAIDDKYTIRTYKLFKDGSSEPFAEVAGNVLSFDVAGLAGETIYNITVKAFDFSGNSAELTGSVTTIADSVSPVWPDGSKLQAKDIKDTSVTLYWNAATDNVGVTKYNIYCNNEFLQTVEAPTTELTVTGLTGATEYTFAVEAVDLKDRKTTQLSLMQWTALNPISTGAAFPFSLESPLSYNQAIDVAGNTTNNVVDGSFTKNNVAFSFAFSKMLANETWLNNIELKDNSGQTIVLDSSAFAYTELADNTSKLKITVPASLVSNGQYKLTIKNSLTAVDSTAIGRNFVWTFNVSVGMYGITDIATGYYTTGLPPSASERFYMVLKDDGTVWTWGNNIFGTLGDGTTDSRQIPTKVEALTGIAAVEAGRNSAFALDSDGAVWGWGSNEFGQLGRGTVPLGTSGRYDNTTPQKVIGLPTIEKISYGYGHVVALDANGEVWNWGTAVQQGMSTDAQCSGTPLKVNGLSNVVDVAAGYYASIAVTSNGDVYTFKMAETPVKVEELSEIVAVGARGIDNNNIWMALKADGTVYTWDSSETPAMVANANLIKGIIADGPYVLATNGQVSNVDYSAEPVLGTGVTTLNNVVKLASSAQGGLALQNDGNLLQFIGAEANAVALNINSIEAPVWPEGSALTITNLAETGLTVNWEKPSPNVSGFAIFKDGIRIATISGNKLSYDITGLTKGQSYTFKVEARFINSDWTTTGPSITQTMNEWNSTMQSAGKIAMSSKHTLMVDGDGNVWAWGQNEYGQLGIGNNTEQLIPVKINGLSNIIAVAAGDNHSLALDSSGNVWAWGKNNLYQLGNGGTTNSNIPVKIISSCIEAISAAADHSIALKNDGTVLGWGADGYATYFSLSGIDGHTPGQLWNATTTGGVNYQLSGVKGIATSRQFTAYLFDDGRICRIGHFIDEVGAPTVMPMKHYSTLMGIQAIAAGENFVIGLEEDGTVVSLGDNNSGQYGNGTQGNGSPADPRPYGIVTGLGNIVEVAAGGYHGVALDNDGNVYTWGKNLYGQLGTGKTDIHLTPVKVADLTGVTAIGGGTESTIAFRSMEKVYAWGNNDNGQLGNNTKTASKIPTVAKMAGSDTDIDAPVWPAYFALMAKNITENSATLMWSPANDDIGVTSYEIYVNDEKKADVEGTKLEYTVSGLTANSAYIFGIKAKDATNTSVMSKTVSATTKVSDAIPNANDIIIDGYSGVGINLPTPEISIPNDALLDVNAGLAVKNGNNIQVAGQNKDLTQFAIDGQTKDLTQATSVGGQAVTVEKAVQLQSAVDNQPTVIKNAELTNITASVPDGTTILAPTEWDGTIKPPTIVDKTGTAPAGFNVGSTVLEVGNPNGVLLFDKPVILTLTGVTGNNFAYKPSGASTWVKMAQAEGTYENPTTPAFPGEAYITDGTNTKIITWHFTQFASLDTVTSPGGGGGGSGGTGANSDQSFTASFTTQSLDSTNTVLQFDFSNGIDQNLSDCLSKIHVRTKTGGTSVQYSSQNYIKQGSNSDPDVSKVRRLELTFNNLQPGTAYVVELDSDLAANNGNKISGTKQWEFTTSGAAVGGVTTPATKSVTTSGGTISDFGTTITIPASAFNSNIEVKIEKLSQISSLPMAVQSKLLSDVIEITKDKSGDFSKPVSITLSFDKTKADQNKYNLSLYWLDEKAGKWVELSNVKVDTTSGKVSGEVQHFTKFAVIATEKAQVPVEPIKTALILKDVTGHWAEANINKLVASGVISGYPDGTFGPDNTISRAEFASIIVRAFKLVPKEGKVFNDTATHWAKDSIATAAGNGIVSGYDSANFGPNDKITREQMAIIIDKVISKNVSTGKTFADGTGISTWAKDAVARVSGSGIISGYPDNTFRPKVNATRAEAVTVILNALSK